MSEALLTFARERNISKIVVGKPAHGRWRDRLKGSLLDGIVRGSGEVDVYIISGERGGEPQAVRPFRGRHPGKPAQYLWSAAVVVVCSLLCWAMHERLDRSNLIMVYLLGVAFVASRYGRGPSAAGALLSVAAFDFFFVPPYLTFAVADTQYLITFGVMLLVSVLISTLAARVRAQADAARQREQRTQVLYAMSRDVAAARIAEEVARAAIRHVSDVFEGNVAVLVPGAAGALEPAGEDAMAGDAREKAVAQWAFDHGHAAGLGTDTLPGASAVWVPLRGMQAVLGVLGLRPDPALLPLRPGPGRPAGGARPAGGVRSRAGAPGRRGAAGSRRGGGGAAAEHAAELRVPRPADAARHDHRGREQLAPGRLARGRGRDGSSRRPSTRRRCASTAS